MGQIINKMKKIPVIDQKTGEYNLRYNIESVTEDYYLPVRGSDSGTNIETLQGLANDGAIDDIEYLSSRPALVSECSEEDIWGRENVWMDILEELEEEGDDHG